jgi:hypothetical protein
MCKELLRMYINFRSNYKSDYLQITIFNIIHEINAMDFMFDLPI